MAKLRESGSDRRARGGGSRDHGGRVTTSHTDVDDHADALISHRSRAAIRRGGTSAWRRCQGRRRSRRPEGLTLTVPDGGGLIIDVAQRPRRWA